jgi:hypothetical protein
MFKKSLSAAIAVASIALIPIPSHAALLGLTLGEPTVDFGGAGIIAYDAVTGVVTISGTPATVFQSDPFILGEVLGTGADDEKLVTIKFQVDANGAFVSGVDGPDLVVTGSVDTDFDTVPNYDGILLQGEVTQFGFLNGVSGANDNFDVRVQFDPTAPGALAPLYAGKDLGLIVTSETSAEFPTPFSGSFATSFTAQAKGVMGSVDVLPPPPPPTGACKIDVEAYCSVDGAPFKNKCRIKVTKSPKHWEHEDFDFDGHTSRHSTYGMHGNPVPTWASRYQSTPITFKYVVTNTGTTPIANLLVKDSFDTPIGSVPTGLAVGQSVTLMRTENLHDGIDVSVKVFGTNSPNRCGDKDVVVVKDKLRERREHDDDNFRDKGRRN